MAELDGHEQDSSELLVSESTTALGLETSKSSLSESRGLSLTVNSLVEQALHVAVSKIRHAKMADTSPEKFRSYDMDDSTTESTQVLVPIHLIPEESMAQVPASPSFIVKHTTMIAVESTMNTGMEIHRNMGASRISGGSKVPEYDYAAPHDNIDRGRTFNQATPNDNSDRREGDRGWSSAGGCENMIDEMSSAVADKDFDGMSVAYLHDLYAKFAEVAQTVSTFPSGSNFTGRNKNGGGAARISPINACAPLSPEVKERVLRTLSDVKLQLDTVRNQLMRQIS